MSFEHSLYKKKLGFVPELSSMSGQCLTGNNWVEINISCLSAYIDHFLFKPGVEVISQAGGISNYLSGPPYTILKTHHLTLSSSKQFQIKSPYDGSNLKFGLTQLIDYINQLKPDAVTLPKGIAMDKALDNVSSDIFIFTHGVDVQAENNSRPTSVYFDKNIQEDHFEKILKDYQSKELPVLFHLEDLQQLEELSKQVGCVAMSDTPAGIAHEGKVIHSDGILDLTSKESSKQFKPICENCHCPTCSQGFTRAYLHYLYHYTPLLCHRYLIQHNVYWFQNQL